jgi:hypothetical protein
VRLPSLEHLEGDWRKNENYGLLVSFGDRQMHGPVSKLHSDYTWVQDSAGNPYLGTTVSILQNEPGQSVPMMKKTTQTLDTCGFSTKPITRSPLKPIAHSPGKPISVLL